MNACSHSGNVTAQTAVLECSRGCCSWHLLRPGFEVWQLSTMLTRGCDSVLRSLAEISELGLLQWILGYQGLSRANQSERLIMKCWKNALQKFWRVLAFLCHPTLKSIDTEMAFLCDFICDTVFYSCNCNKMVALFLCSSLRVWACLVQPFLHWREYAGLFRSSNLVLYLRLQDVYLDADRADGSWDKAAG